jgi:NADH dehydrogenase (ubiquinone) Fe-S protein 3
MQYNFFKKSYLYLNLIVPFQNIFYYKESTIVHVNLKFLEFLLFILKKHTNFQFKLLTSISGIDFPNRDNRFTIVYELLSISFNMRIRIKTFLNEITPITTKKHIYISATWWEREIWDMFGIFFLKNNEMRRILTDYGFEGYPLRKDFPLTGYVETRYDDSLKRVICEPIEYSQNFRIFNFTTGWSLSF